jgi:hypothetical protein
MPIVKVTAVSLKGFRRCGMQFTREPKEVEVTPAQLKELKAEKNLIIVEMPEDKKKDK